MIRKGSTVRWSDIISWMIRISKEFFRNVIEIFAIKCERRPHNNAMSSLQETWHMRETIIFRRLYGFKHFTLLLPWLVFSTWYCRRRADIFGIIVLLSVHAMRSIFVDFVIGELCIALQSFLNVFNVFLAYAFDLSLIILYVS